jgi:hypothetical protein
MNCSKKNKKDNYMNKDVFGIHHVTAITSDTDRNLLLW